MQAEDGIRNLTVTGVQTCALPISDALAASQSASLGIDIPTVAELSAFYGRPVQPFEILSRNVPVELFETGVTNTFSGAVSGGTDRKSTRLNSSHSQISYAVFCLKK